MKHQRPIKQSAVEEDARDGYDAVEIHPDRREGDESIERWLAASEQDEPFKQHARSTDVRRPAAEKSLQDADPLVAFRSAQIRAHVLKEDHRQAEHNRLREAVLELADALIRRAFEQCL